MRSTTRVLSPSSLIFYLTDACKQGISRIKQPVQKEPIMKNVFLCLMVCFSLSPLAQAQVWNPAPAWYYPGIPLPVWQWAPTVQYGYWQCVSFNQYLQPFTYFALNLNQAAYGAIYTCSYYSPYEMCYVPPGYCQFRY